MISEPHDPEDTSKAILDGAASDYLKDPSNAQGPGLLTIIHIYPLSDCAADSVRQVIHPRYDVARFICPCFASTRPGRKLL